MRDLWLIDKWQGNSYYASKNIGGQGAVKPCIDVFVDD